MSWLRVQMAGLDAASALVSFAANWLLQSTLLIAAGLAVAWLLHRRGSAVQSAIYRTTLATVVVCPLASGFLSLAGVSGWSLPMPAAWTYEESTTPRIASPEPPGTLSVAPPRMPERQAGEAIVPQPGRQGYPPETEVGLAPEPPRQLSYGRIESAAGVQPAPGNLPAQESPARSGVGPSAGTAATSSGLFQVRAYGMAAMGMALTWLSASAWLLARLGLAWRRLNRLCEEGVPAEPAIQEACRAVTALFEVAAPRVLRSPYVTSPCLAGWPRSTVLLPEADPSLPARDVLIHELAHLRRGDAGWNLLGRLAEALFFYQPLIWLLTRRLEAAAEEVCDDYVVQFGGDRSRYARGLVEIAELSTAPVGAAAVAIVSLKSILAKRVIRIMDPSRSLSTRAGNLLLGVVIVGGLIGTVIVGFVGLGPQPSAEAQPPDTSVKADSRTDDEKPKASELVAKAKAATAADDVARPPSAGASSDIDDDLVTVSGRVVDPQGKPFAGAKLYAVRWYWEPHIPHSPLAETTSDADGRFTVAYRKSQFTVDVGRMEQWKEVSIVATADGFGPGWLTWRDLPRGEEATLRLVPDDVPIAGRVVDLEGNPVAGVAVRVGSIHTGKGGNLDGWLAAVRRGEFPWTAVEHLDDSLPQFDGWPPLVVTDDDGRFGIDGLGRERRVDLSFSGPTIAYEDVHAVTRRSDLFPLKFSRSEKEFDTVYGAEFELVAAPTQPITGIVRDAETQRPLPGVSIESDMFAGSNFAGMRQLRAVSDDNGRYRLVGMPKGAGNRVLAVPNDDQPYLMREVKVPESRGLDAVNLDIELHRGIWITGRVTDRATGGPLMARLHYLPFLSNEYARKTPEFGEPGSADGFQGRYVSQPDGKYRLVGLPGRAIVGAECLLGRYLKGVGADNITGMDEHGHFDTYPNPVQPSKMWPHAMTEIDPSPGTETVVCDLALDPGEKVMVNIVDPDGKPVGGFESQGSGQDWSESQNLNVTFDVIALGPDETRTVIIRHKERKLGKVVRVRLADHPSRSLTVTLDPAARVIGRLVDGQGTPISGAAIEAWLKPTGDFSQRLPTTTTDEQGRFDYTDVPTGCHYRLRAEAAGMTRGGRSFAEDVAVEPGETKDLGDVVYGGTLEGNKNAGTTDDPAGGKSEAQPGQVGKEKRQDSGAADKSNKQADKKQPASDNELRGVVTGADGRPVAGAKLYWIRSRIHEAQPQPPQLLATTGEDGQFRFAAPPAVAETTPASWSYIDGIVITAPGHGFVLTSPHEIRRSAEEGISAALARAVSGRVGATSLPAAGEPIRGRLIDIDGRPLAGAMVRIRWFNDERDHMGVADAETRGAKDAVWSARVAFLLNVIEQVRLREVLPMATTNADGWFELRGIGPKRLVQLLVQGDAIESTEIIARNEPGEKIVIDANRHTRGSAITVYPNEFVHAVGPSKPVEGRVLDLDTGEPIVGAVVRAFDVHGEPVRGSREREHFATTTDADGRYRIAGLPIGPGNKLVAFGTGRVAYAPVAHTADTSADGAAIKLDFRLKRGVWAEGRVFEAESQKPFTGEISYSFFRNRELEEAIPGLRHAYVDGLYWTNAEGEFRVPVLPSRGILAFRYDGRSMDRDGIDRFPRGFGADDIAGSEKFGAGKQFPTEPFYLIPENYERVAEVAPAAGQESVRVDMPLFASPPVTVRVQAMGEPVTKFEAYGNERWGWQQHDGPEFAIEDLRPGERRKVFVFHRGQSLAGGGFVEYGAKQAVRIELVKAGSVTGRLVDADGEPINDATLFANYEKLRSDDNSAIWASHPSLTANPTNIPVDKNGRFRLDGLIPGWSYHAYASAPRPIQGQILGIVIGTAFKGVEVNAGENKDLGDLVVRADQSDSADDTKKVSAAQPAEAKTVRGRVTRGGRPAAGAHVAVIARSTATARGGEFSSDQSAVLAEATADEKGEYVLQLAGVSQKTHIYANLIARQDGSAVTWRQLNLDLPQTEAALDLSNEEPIRGKLIDLEGQPASGVRMSIVSVIESTKGSTGGSALPRFGFDDGSAVDYHGVDKVPAAWLAPMTSDEQGKFVIHGVAANNGVMLEVAGDDRFARQDIALNTGRPEERGERDATYRSLVKNAKPGEEALLTLAPAQLFEGVVKYADTNEPVPGARMTIWASQQELGSMMGVAGRADEKGHYRISPRPGIRFGLTAHPPSGVPYLARQTPLERAIRWDGGERVKQVDLTLPRGVLVRGKVMEAGSDVPVAGAALQYVPETSNNHSASRDILTGWQGTELTDQEGRFAMAVLPGPGRLLVSGPQGRYVLQEIGERELSQGQPGGTRNYAHAVRKLNPEVGQEAIELKVELQPGATVNGRVVDKDGNAIHEVLIISRLKIPEGSLFWVAHTAPTLGGRFEVSGLAEGVEYPVYFLDPKRRLGATQVVKAGDSEMTVVLKPCGKAALKTLDSKGEPVRNFANVQMVVTPGALRYDFDALMRRGEFAADADFVANVDRTNNTFRSDDEGRLKLPALIPGATYQVYGLRDGKWLVVREFQVKADEMLDLGDLVVQDQQ